MDSWEDRCFFISLKILIEFLRDWKAVRLLVILGFESGLEMGFGKGRIRVFTRVIQGRLGMRMEKWIR